MSLFQNQLVKAGTVSIKSNLYWSLGFLIGFYFCYLSEGNTNAAGYIASTAVDQENLIKFGYPNTGSLLTCNHSFVFGSEGYPLPNSPVV